MLRKLGVIINPIAGLGGSVGLKGTDNMVEQALLRGAKPQSEERMRKALMQLKSLQPDITIYTGSGNLGGTVSKDLGYSCVIEETINPEKPISKNSKDLCEWIEKQDVDLILFAGGDGTACDLYQVAQGKSVFLGVPSGVKIHSPVYAINPIAAGQLALRYLSGDNHKTCEAEVVDLDETLYRQEVIQTKLCGYLTIPSDEKYMQNRKSPSPISQEETVKNIARRIVETMEPDTYYIIGAGTTTRAIMEQLELANTLIGVDIIQNKTLVKKDVFGAQIIDCLQNNKAKFIISVIGGQGFLLGRGNQSITPEVVRLIGKENIIIVATKEKLVELKGRPLHLDTGDSELDQELSGYYRVIVSYNEEVIYQVKYR